MKGGAVGHNFEMGLPNDYPSQIWFNLVQALVSQNEHNVLLQLHSKE
jgi:hypothetical protein